MPGPQTQSLSSWSPTTGHLYSLPVCLYSWAASSSAGFSSSRCGMVGIWSGGGRGPIMRPAGPGGAREKEVFGPASSPLWTRSLGALLQRSL